VIRSFCSDRGGLEAGLSQSDQKHKEHAAGTGGVKGVDPCKQGGKVVKATKKKPPKGGVLKTRPLLFQNRGKDRTRGPGGGSAMRHHDIGYRRQSKHSG